MKNLIILLSLLISITAIASVPRGSVSKTLSMDLVQTLWSNGASLLSPADAFFRDEIANQNSNLVKEIKKIYEENVEPYAQPKFPQSFRDLSLKEKAIIVSEGNSSLYFGKSYIVPLYGAVGSKTEALIAWIVIDIHGEIDGDTTISLSVKETDLF